MSLIENFTTLLTSLLLSVGFTLHDPCSEMANAVKASGQNTDASLVKEYTDAACDDGQPLELRQILVSKLYTMASETEQQENAVKWATFSVDTNPSYITYSNLFQVSSFTHKRNIEQYAASNDFTDLVNKASSYGVKFAISQKILRVGSQDSNQPSGMTDKIAWTVVGLFDFSGGNSYLNTLNPLLADMARELIKTDDILSKTFQDDWSKYELDDQYDQYMKPAIEKAPLLVKYSMDLAPYKKVAESAQADYERNAAVRAQKKAEEDARLAKEKADIDAKPYTIKISCYVGDSEMRVSVMACADSVSVSYPGRTESYGGRDLLQVDDLTAFSINIPQHFSLVLQASNKRNISARLVIKDRRTGTVTYTGNTSGAYDVLKVEN